MTQWERFIEGLYILMKYTEGKKQYLQADHDVIWVAATEAMPEGDIERLEELGFHIDSSNDCWAVFV